MVTVIIRTISEVIVMVIWIVIRYIIIADTSRSALRILSKAIIVIIRIIICDMVMTI